ncbi:MAG: DUF1080 domain-containing protein [Phycisphaerae bacterium]|nr:DUF1080 domain-containing protein [Phycisphaerae bacterium]
MRIDIKKIAVISVFVGAVLLPCALAEVTDPAAVNCLKNMPAGDAQQEQALNAELIKAGPNAVMQLCDVIIPPGTGDDTKARYALGSLTNYASRPGADQERQMVETVLGKALTKSSDQEVKFFFIGQLQFVGSGQSVSVLSQYLDDERLCDQASGTLLVIGTAAAEQAFLKALSTASATQLPMIMHALGQMQSQGAVRSITRHAASQDAVIRRVAIQALGNIGDESSVATLEKATRVDDPYEKGLAVSAYLRLAERLNQTGKNRVCVRMCRQLMAQDDAPQGNVSCGALSLLSEALGDGAIKDLLEAVDSDNPKVQAAALVLAQKIEGARATTQWTQKLKSVSPDRQVKIIGMLETRGDRAALPALWAYMDHDNTAVKLSALKAVAQLDGAAAVPDLMAAMKNAQDDEIQAVTSLLMQLPTAPVVQAVISALPQMSAKKQVALIDMLAERRAQTSVDTVFTLTAASDSAVSIAATRALGQIASQDDLSRVIDLMLNTENSRLQAEAGRVVVTLCQQNEDSQNRASLLLSALNDADKAQEIVILSLLPAIGGSEAFKVVLASTKSTDSKVQDAAIRGLAKWKDAEALDALFEIASSTQAMNYLVMTLRGAIDLVVDGSPYESDRVALYGKALAIARRPDEKKLVLSKLALIRTEQALAVVSPFVGDNVLGQEATLTVMKIVFGGRNDEPLSGSEVITALQKVVQANPDDATKNKAASHLDALVKEQAKLNQPPEGFVALFNGKDLTGWKGLLASPNDNPIRRARLSPEALAAEQAKADAKMRQHWTVKDGVLHFDGGGFSLATVKNYEDFEMWVDWKVLEPNGDSGIYLRGTPQVQIWDPAHWKIGSGGLYNNQKNPSKPTSIADNPIGQWNTFYIKMVGERVTVHLNGKLVVDNVILENYWDRKQPIFPSEQIELQCHGNPIDFRNIYIRELPTVEPGFVSLFNSTDTDLTGWVGDTNGYLVQDGTIVCKPGGNLYTEKQYSDFVFRFEFKLTPGANNGLGIRAPLTGDAAYQGMELQILDDTADQYKNLQPYQYHGSIYGVVPVKRGHQKPVGEWNTQEVIARGNQITVILNGVTVVDADIKEASKNGTETMDHRPHPGLLRKTGHIGFLGHGSVVEFRNIRIQANN